MTVAAGLSSAPSAHASNFGVELNGTYRVTTNGEFAKDQRRLQGRADHRRELDAVLQLCEPDRMRRHGDQLRRLDRSVVVRLPEHVLGRRSRHPRTGSSAPTVGPPPASRGSSSGGSTRYPPNDSQRSRTSWSGRQRTNSPSGSCGTNQPLVIETPLKLEQWPSRSSDQIGSRSFHVFGACPAATLVSVSTCPSGVTY